jgi:hypothetical protein
MTAFKICFTLTFFKMKGLSKLQELFGELEQLTEDQQGHLIGGFATIGGSQTALFEGDNNCGTNNCTSNCIPACAGTNTGCSNASGT